MSEEIVLTRKDDRRAFWMMHIQQCKESNLNQATYCAQEEISFSSFVKWKSILFPKQKSENNKVFLPVKIDTKQSNLSTQHQSIQIKLAVGHIVYIPTTMDVKQIATLINYLSAPHA